MLVEFGTIRVSKHVADGGDEVGMCKSPVG